VAGTGPQERPAAYKEWPSRNLPGPRSVPLPRACVVSLGVHAACQGGGRGPLGGLPPSVVPFLAVRPAAAVIP
jgi:hypothetical protein